MFDQQKTSIKNPKSPTRLTMNAFFRLMPPNPCKEKSYQKVRCQPNALQPMNIAN